MGIAWKAEELVHWIGCFFPFPFFRFPLSDRVADRQQSTTIMASAMGETIGRVVYTKFGRDPVFKRVGTLGLCKASSSVEVGANH